MAVEALLTARRAFNGTKVDNLTALVDQIAFVVDETATLDVPTLILGGDHAVYSMLATGTADALTAANPLVEYRVVVGAGHSPHRDKPDETLPAIAEWLLAH